jgi:hypothetical protein
MKPTHFAVTRAVLIFRQFSEEDYLVKLSAFSCSTLTDNENENKTAVLFFRYKNKSRTMPKH